jgi:hypothetical protein
VPDARSSPAERARATARTLWHRLPTSAQRTVLETPPARWTYRSLWARPGHFYSPFPDLDEVAGRRAAIYGEGAADLPGIDLHAADQLELLAAIGPLTGDVPEAPTDGWRYHLDNVPFPCGDGLVLAGMLRHLRPNRIVEVGSGWSTRLLLDIRRRDLPDLALTVIDPFPRITEDEESATLVPRPVQEAPLWIFDELAAGDVLFIDSSHVAKAGSDVTHLYFEVLPRLAPGVLVHVHDIHWPFEYPESWLRQGRAWNEAYLVRSLVLGGALDVALWLPYLAAVHPKAVDEHLPRAWRNTGGSIWTRIPSSG